MATITWSARAIQDIQEIAEFIGKDSIQYAKLQTQSFFEKASLLENHLEIGRMVPKLKDPTIRQLLCGSYRLIYEIKSASEVSVLTVHHQSRLLENNPAFKS